MSQFAVAVAGDNYQACHKFTQTEADRPFLDALLLGRSHFIEAVRLWISVGFVVDEIGLSCGYELRHYFEILQKSEKVFEGLVLVLCFLDIFVEFVREVHLVDLFELR